MSSENKKLGRFDIFSMGVGGAIGSGIFVMLGIGISFTGRSISLAVFIGCLYMLLAFFYQLIMSSMFVLKGGDYDAKAMLMSPTLVGVNAIFTYLAGMTLSAYAVSIVEYTGMIFPAILPYTSVLATLIMTLFFASTIKGSKFVSMLLNVMTIILLISLGLFIAFGIVKVEPGYLKPEDFFLNGSMGFIQALAFMGFACMGTTMGPISVMTDTKDARKIVPSTILLICLTVGVVYGLMAIVASGVLPIEQVVGQNLSVVSKTIFPNWLFVIFILGGAVFAIATSMLGGIQMLRYPCEQVAIDGWFPPFFKKQTKGGYPWVIMLLFYLISIFPIITGISVADMISLYMIPAMLFNVYLNIKLIKIIKQYPKQWQTSVLHVPDKLFNVLCVISAICALSVSYFLFISLTPLSMILCGALIAVCVAFAVIQLKRGVVSKEALLEKRNQIAKEALKLSTDK